MLEDIEAVTSSDALFAASRDGTCDAPAHPSHAALSDPRTEATEALWAAGLPGLPRRGREGEGEDVSGGLAGPGEEEGGGLEEPMPVPRSGAVARPLPRGGVAREEGAGETAGSGGRGDGHAGREPRADARHDTGVSSPEETGRTRTDRIRLDSNAPAVPVAGSGRREGAASGAVRVAVVREKMEKRGGRERRGGGGAPGDGMERREGSEGQEGRHGAHGRARRRQVQEKEVEVREQRRGQERGRGESEEEKRKQDRGEVEASQQRVLLHECQGFRHREREGTTADIPVPRPQRAVERVHARQLAAGAPFGRPAVLSTLGLRGRLEAALGEGFPRDFRLPQSVDAAIERAAAAEATALAGREEGMYTGLPALGSADDDAMGVGVKTAAKVRGACGRRVARCMRRCCAAERHDQGTGRRPPPHRFARAGRGPDEVTDRTQRRHPRGKSVGYAGGTEDARGSSGRRSQARASGRGRGAAGTGREHGRCLSRSVR